MNLRQIADFWRRLAAVAVVALPPAGCAFLEGPEPVNPLIGTWSNADNDRVTFKPDAVVITPNKGPSTAMGPGDCNGVYRLAYGRMSTAPFARLFPAQPDLEAKLKDMLIRPEYPVADVTCGRGGTSYLLIGDREVLAIYRDAGVGGLEHLHRL